MIAHQNTRTRIPHQRAVRIRESAHTPRPERKQSNTRPKISKSNSRLGTHAKSIRTCASQGTTRILNQSIRLQSSKRSGTPPPSTVLRPAHEPKTKKSLLIATFLRLGIVASSPDRRLRSENAAKWLYCDSFRFAGAKGSPQSQKCCKKLVIFVFAIG